MSLKEWWNSLGGPTQFEERIKAADEFDKFKSDLAGASRQASSYWSAPKKTAEQVLQEKEESFKQEKQRHYKLLSKFIHERKTPVLEDFRMAVENLVKAAFAAEAINGMAKSSATSIIYNNLADCRKRLEMMAYATTDMSGEAAEAFINALDEGEKE